YGADAKTQAAASGVGQTVVHVAAHANGTLAPIGMILLADQIKPDSAAAIAELHEMGLRTLLLTGDNEATARAIAQQVGIDDVRADVRPPEKAAVVRELQDGNSHTAMVGDG